ncbi:MAG: type II toxin-antitoxin system RelE/ParE family toxin [Candidatus Aenigmarchaeota archaeon]|nr:type II toxin-antitoxin system RelE/ParE family toxin [Candidatus Aenigmarchaeota archaeon]
MSYSLEVKLSCQESITKLCKKNPVLQEALCRKIQQIILNPDHYKPLKYELAGERRVHILKSFVLKFEVDETNKTVTLMTFSHHDDAYRR